ncbi:MAG TPA: PilZ domain-containing protein [Candidatus Methylomirabilis sp.]|nr:PilZ domain-containing protein [Candidatus Methylomirabilis sp.]
MASHELGDHFTRCAIDLPFRYREATEAAYRPGVGRTRDLSGAGAWVELPERVAPPTLLDVSLRAPGEPLRLAAQVVWGCPESDERSWLHGLRFTRITPAQRERLGGLLTHQKSRDVERLYCTLAATCRSKAADFGPLPCETRDVSSGGVALRLPTPVPPGTPLQVTILTPFGTITADAQVVWAEPSDALPRGAPCRHGLRFLHIEPSSELPLKLLLAGLR